MSRELKLITNLICDLSENFEVSEINSRYFQVFDDATRGNIEYNTQTRKLIVAISSVAGGVLGAVIFHGVFTLNDDYQDILMFIKTGMTR